MSGYCFLWEKGRREAQYYQADQKTKEENLGGEHTNIQCTHNMLQNSTPETYIILLTNVTPVNSTKE